MVDNRAPIEIIKAELEGNVEVYALQQAVITLAEALELYADDKSWTATRIGLGNGTTIGGPAFGFGSGIAADILKVVAAQLIESNAFLNVDTDHPPTEKLQTRTDKYWICDECAEEKSGVDPSAIMAKLSGESK